MAYQDTGEITQLEKRTALPLLVTEKHVLDTKTGERHVRVEASIPTVCLYQSTMSRKQLAENPQLLSDAYQSVMCSVAELVRTRREFIVATLKDVSNKVRQEGSGVGLAGNETSVHGRRGAGSGADMGEAPGTEALPDAHGTGNDDGPS